MAARTTVQIADRRRVGFPSLIASARCRFVRPGVRRRQHGESTKPGPAFRASGRVPVFGHRADPPRRLGGRRRAGRRQRSARRRVQRCASTCTFRCGRWSRCRDRRPGRSSERSRVWACRSNRLRRRGTRRTVNCFREVLGPRSVANDERRRVIARRKSSDREWNSQAEMFGVVKRRRGAVGRQPGCLGMSPQAIVASVAAEWTLIEYPPVVRAARGAATTVDEVCS